MRLLMNYTNFKTNNKIIGSIIKFNRLSQNLNQKTLSKGICVPSYLSRIENGDLIPSEELLSVIFNRLGLTFNDSEDFLCSGSELFTLFFNKLYNNEFEYTDKIFNEIEKDEKAYMTSPLILDYLLVKLARFCATDVRDKFEPCKSMIESSIDLLSPIQKYRFYFYSGVDTLSLSHDKTQGKEFIEQALRCKETGHCYFWLSYAYRTENNAIKAYECISKALTLYVAEGNIISVMDTYEKFAEVYYLLDNYQDAILYLNMSLNIASKFNNINFIEHLNSLLAWTYYRLKDYEKSLNYLKLNKGIMDHRMRIPDNLIYCLIYFENNDRIKLGNTLSKLYNPECLQQINKPLMDSITNLFTYYIESTDFIKTSQWEFLIIDIINNLSTFVELEKVFKDLLKDYYIQNRRYKDALYL